jgi:hypothetical protein
MHKLIPFIFCILIIGCAENGISDPPDISIQVLQSTPDTITVENRVMYLSTYLWRDFQPMIGVNGSALIGLFYVTAIDSFRLSSNISADAVWIIHNNQVWKSLFSHEPAPDPELRPNRIVKIARNGPPWGPDVFVDVIVRITDGKGGSKLLRSSKQGIGSTH